MKEPDRSCLRASASDIAIDKYDCPKILHRGRDQAARVNPASVYLGYRLALAMVARLDQSACAAYK